MSTDGSVTPLPHPVPSSDELGPLVGKTFGGYEITSYIGEGPTGAVYRAEDMLGSRMAVKVMHKELSRKDTSDKLFAELKKLSVAASPRMVQVCDGGFGEEGQFFFVMDELIGSDLESGLEESGALAPGKAIAIIREICLALDEAHALGVVHGGLKPRNVFLVPGSGELKVKVLDFGASRLAGGLDKGVIVGNPFYMAPEQFGGASDPRTDIYAVGVMMYELFSGTLPFAGPSHGQVMMRHLAEVPHMPPGVDEELGRIILRCLVKAPAGRYGSVKQLLAALDRWQGTRPSMLSDAAAFAVIQRASDARAMKQSTLSHPDATSPMPKLDLAELARHTTRNHETPPVHTVSTTTKRPENDNNPNSSESVESSLEDFINQANASFPAATSDGWDLHTGDVELLDEAEEQLEKEEHVSAPLVVKPRSDGGAAPGPRGAKKTVKGMPVVQAAEPVAPVAEPAKKKTTKNMPVVAAPLPAPVYDPPAEETHVDPEAEPLDPPPSAPRRKFEKTDIVSAPYPLSPPSVPWTANPLVIIGGLLAAFVVGAGLVFLMVRSMMPSQNLQPVVVQAPGLTGAPPPVPQIQPQPVVAQPVAQPVTQPTAQPAAAPVVTPLPAAAAPTAPVVTPLPAAGLTGAPPPVPENPPVAKPAAPAKKAAARPAAKKAEKQAAARAERPEPAPRAEKPAAKAEKPAPKAEKPAKKESKGSDWVDPFAN